MRVGQVTGLPVVTDPNLSVTQGSESGGGNEDYIYVAGTYSKRFLSCLLRLNLQTTFNARLSECTWPY